MTTIEVPQRMRHLPRDPYGRPVPWFVAWFDGEPDFRVIGHGKVRDAIRFDQCWVCGRTRGRTAAFVIGPMCAVNRVSAEPPSHLECATYSARVCPFLTTPRMRRRERNLPDTADEPAGGMIARNPGVTLVWSSRTWRPFRAPDGGVLFDVGDPMQLAWWTEGRAATVDEVIAAIDSGLPILREQAERDGPEAVEALRGMVEEAMQLVIR